MNGFRPFPDSTLGGFTIIEVPLTRVEVQNRRHKRKSSRRWQKKWRKRFGTHMEYLRTFKAGEMIVNEASMVIYAHPEEIRALRAGFNNL